jgi:Domain of unknown function (DUF5658)
MGLRDSLSSRFGTRIADHFREVYERDRQWIMGLNMSVMNDLLWPLFIAYLCLNFLDVYMTTLAMNFGPLFHELNPLAAALFDRQFQGYLLALTLKYLPVIPIFYVVFATDRDGSHPFGLRIVKFSVLIALIGANALLFYVVGIHNLESLLGISFQF